MNVCRRINTSSLPTHILDCFGDGHHLDLRMGRHTGIANLSHDADRLPIGISILTILALSALSWAAVAGIVMLFV